MFSADRKYKIHWELTDLCNLKCPMCPRTNIFDRCQPIKEVQNTQFFLNDVEEYFPANFVKDWLESTSVELLEIHALPVISMKSVNY